MKETMLLIHFEDEERARKIKLMAISLKMRIVQVKKKIIYNPSVTLRV